MMPISIRMLTLSGFLPVAALGVPTAHAATFTNGPGVSSVCLEARGGIHLNPKPVQAFPCNGTFAQVWNYAGFTIFGLGTTEAVGKCLDVAGGGTAAGTPVQLFSCNGTGAQTWVYSAGRVINTRSGKCLDVGNGAPGTQATIQTCNGSSGQNWVIR
jgi:Ricin-type beta-trefoil lectin domain